MSSDDSDDEPLSNKAALKAIQKVKLASSYKTKPKQSKNYDKIRLKKLATSTILTSTPQKPAPTPIQRPTDAWLYLKDLSISGPFTCLLCSEIFVNKTKVAVHYIVNHKKSYCGSCRYFVHDQEAWLHHQQFHVPKYCSQCCSTHYMDQDLRDHLKLEHNLVHCQLCHFLIADGESYDDHLAQKHLVKDFNWKDSEFLWEASDTSLQFKCLLCTKNDLLKINFSSHYISHHKVTLKCLSNCLNNKETGITILGTHIGNQLNNGQQTMGYDNMNSKISKTDFNGEEDNYLLSSLVPEIKIESVPDTGNVIQKMIQNELDNVHEINTGTNPLAFIHGQEDFDTTLVELIVLQKSYYDYVEIVNNEVVTNSLAITTKIDYGLIKSKSVDVDCPFCQENYNDVQGYSSHLTKCHGLRFVPFYSCRACLNHYDNYSNLDLHVNEENSGYKNLWLCQFCEEEFDDKQPARKHLTNHLNVINRENCYSPHLGFKCKYCAMIFWNEFDRERHHTSQHWDDKNKCDFYKCADCDDVFSENIYLIHHIFSNHPLGFSEAFPFLYKCCLCCKVLSTLDFMRSHFFEHHPMAKKTFCSLGDCNIRPLLRGQFKVHMKVKHEIGPGDTLVSCSMCACQFPNQRLCDRHMNQYHKRGRFKCAFCDEFYHTGEERKLHYMLQHPDAHPYSCGICPRKFKNKASLYKHKIEHRALEIFKCEYCSKEFNKKESYREHLQIHTGPRHACSFCPRMFVQRSNMVRHERRHTGERPYTCQYCDKTFTDKGACNSHSRNHTQKFTCDHCGQGFVQKPKLVFHMRKHTGEDLETCPVCLKVFTSVFYLKKHQKIHEKPGGDERQGPEKSSTSCSMFSDLETCSVCFKVFTNVFALREHRKIHVKNTEGIKCPLCSRMFVGLYEMQRHMKSAHGSDALTCPICSRHASDTTSLKGHILTHGKTYMFKCTLCSSSYSTKRTLSRHIRSSHAKLLKDNKISIHHYTKLDPREMGLPLDNATISEYFGPPSAEFIDKIKNIANAFNAMNQEAATTDMQPTNFCTVTLTEVKKEVTSDGESSQTDESESKSNKAMFDDNNETETAMDYQNDPINFVSVKVEPLDDDYDD